MYKLTSAIEYLCLRPPTMILQLLLYYLSLGKCMRVTVVVLCVCVCLSVTALAAIHTYLVYIMSRVRQYTVSCIVIIVISEFNELSQILHYFSNHFFLSRDEPKKLSRIHYLYHHFGYRVIIIAHTVPGSFASL